MRPTAASLLLALGLTCLPGPGATQEPSPPAPSRTESALTDDQMESAVQRFQELAKAGQFQLVYPAEGVVVDLPGPTRVEGASEADLKYGLPVLLAELQVYPPSFLRRLRLTVAFGRRVYWVNGQPVGRTGVTLGGRGLLCLDTSSHPAQVLAHSTQHEFFHAIEQQLGLPLDNIWLPLNAPGTQYNGQVPLTIPFGVAQNLPGFVSAYAQSAGREDR